MRKPVPTEEQFAAEMETRYQRMLAGEESQRDLIEMQAMSYFWNDQA